ncbi:MAG: hypothetical protein ABIM89_13520 [Mycobacteriales bacterium]
MSGSDASAPSGEPAQPTRGLSRDVGALVGDVIVWSSKDGLHAMNVTR